MAAIPRLMKTLVMVGVRLEMSLPGIPHIVFEIFCVAVDGEMVDQMKNSRRIIIPSASFTVQLANTHVLTLLCRTLSAQMHCESVGIHDDPSSPVERHCDYASSLAPQRGICTESSHRTRGH